MKGLIKLNPESLISLINDCRDVICNFDKSIYEKKELRWSWKKFKKIEFTIYDGVPFWYQYKSDLQDHFYALYKTCKQASKYSDEIWMSELSYTHLCLLRGGHRNANPIYIINY